MRSNLFDSVSDAWSRYLVILAAAGRPHRSDEVQELLRIHRVDHGLGPHCSVPCFSRIAISASISRHDVRIAGPWIVSTAMPARRPHPQVRGRRADRDRGHGRRRRARVLSSDWKYGPSGVFADISNPSLSQPLAQLGQQHKARDRRHDEHDPVVVGHESPFPLVNRSKSRSTGKRSTLRQILSQRHVASRRHVALRPSRRSACRS